VLRLAHRKRVTVKETLLLPKHLAVAEECFITNTTLEIMPVTTIDRKRVGTGRPGPITGLLLEAYRREVLACSKIPAT
jgi:branched-chain amino acid aminotransferase